MGLNEIIQSHCNELYSNEGFRRERARVELQNIGKPAVPELIKLLAHENDHARCEACKALGFIKDPESGRALASVLGDKRWEVRWIAAEGLISMGQGAIIPLLQTLELQFADINVRQSAHHILHGLEKQFILAEKLKSILDALRFMEPDEKIAVAAHEALTSSDKIS